MARIQEIIFKYPAFNIVERPQRKYEVLPLVIFLAMPIRLTKLTSKKISFYYLPGDIAGITGVERSYEKQLRGKKE